jgi:pimeloyl-ACP methyl ester carboxylesterase
VSAGLLVAQALTRAHRIAPRAAGYVWTSIFTNTRGLGTIPNDLCPLGASRVELTGVPRVAAVYVWGSAEPTVLALHGWGADSTTMSSVVAAATDSGESAVCFDAPGHGVSPGTQATMREYADATLAVLQRFPSITTIVAHSFAAIAAVSAVAAAASDSVRFLLLLAPACSLSDVLERWAAHRDLPPAVVEQIRRELRRRDGMEVSHWDVRTLGLPASVRVQIVHDPADALVPVSDSYRIAASISAEVQATVPGVGHHRIVSCHETRRALTARAVPSDRASSTRPCAGTPPGANFSVV